MLRKLFSATLVIVLSILTFGPISAAQAAPISSDIIDMPSGATVRQIIPINDQKSLAIWQDDDGLKSSVFHANGTFDSTALISPAISGHYVSLAERNSWIKFADGSFAIAWATSWHSGSTDYSEVSIAFSDDGLEWSTSVNPSQRVSMSSMDCMMIFNCGYREVQVATNSLGAIAIQYEVSASQSANTIQSQISYDGATWSSATRVAEGYSYSFARSIIGLDGGGFLSTWGQSDGKRYSSRTSTSKLATWTRPAVISEDDNLNYEMAFAKTGPAEYTAFYVTYTSANRFVKARTYSTITKSWGAARVVIETPTTHYPQLGVKVSQLRNGKIIVSLPCAVDGQSLSVVYINAVTANSVGTQSILTSVASQSTDFSEVSLNGDNSMTVVRAPLNGDVTIVTYLNGTEIDNKVIPFADAQTVGLATAFSTSGNVFLVAARSPAFGFTYQRATTPVAAGTPRITGTAKNGSKVTSAPVIFGGISGIGVTTYQWYSCSRVVPANVTSLPVGCSPISKATLASFKITSKQKGKYVTVALRNTNAFGTTTLFAPSSTKAK